MIVVNAVLKKDEIKEVLTELKDPSFNLKKEQGLQMFFETDSEDSEKAAEIAKRAIKDKIGKEIMFSVNPA